MVEEMVVTEVVDEVSQDQSFEVQVLIEVESRVEEISHVAEQRTK